MAENLKRKRKLQKLKTRIPRRKKDTMGYEQHRPGTILHRTISENTTVQVGLVLAVLGFVAGAMWWAATINAKVDSLLTVVGSNATEAAQLRKELLEIRDRVLVLENRRILSLGSGNNTDK